MAKFFNVGMTDAADGTITHTLSTTLIGPDGKVLKFYPGNEWTPEQVVDGSEAVAWGVSAVVVNHGEGAEKAWLMV